MSADRPTRLSVLGSGALGVGSCCRGDVAGSISTPDSVRGCRRLGAFRISSGTEVALREPRILALRPRSNHPSATANSCFAGVVSLTRLGGIRAGRGKDDIAHVPLAARGCTDSPNECDESPDGSTPTHEQPGERHAPPPIGSSVVGSLADAAERGGLRCDARPNVVRRAKRGASSFAHHVRRRVGHLALSVVESAGPGPCSETDPNGCENQISGQRGHEHKTP